MKSIYILTVFLLIPFLVYSQATESAPVKSSKGIYLGADLNGSLPLGAYSDYNFDDGKSGYSNFGFLGQVNCDLVSKSNFGLAFQYSYQYNPLKDTAKNVQPSGIPAPLGTGGWSNHYLMGGPVYLNFFGKLFFEAKILAGLIISTSSLFKTMDPETKAISANAGIGFAYEINIGIGVSLSPKVALKFNAGYLGATPKISKQYPPEIVGVDSAGYYIYSAPVTIETKRTISSFNFGLGLVYKL
jgi:hypothetical protein